MTSFSEARDAQKEFIDAHKAHVPNVECYWHREENGSVRTTLRCDPCGAELKSDFPNGLLVELENGGARIPIHTAHPNVEIANIHPPV